MIFIEIPGFGAIAIKHLVMDYNGTLAVDGQIIQEAVPILRELGQRITIHVITADTFGSVRNEVSDIDCRLVILQEDNQDVEKRDYVRSIGAEAVMAVGNGRNDQKMLKEAILGIAVLQNEGVFTGTVSDADILCTSIVDALDLLRFPKRLVATLRR